MGIETEYSIRGRSESPAKTPFNFDRFSHELERRTPIASSFRNPYRAFLANGGCFSLEFGFSADLNNVLLELATPECKSPRELISYQIALEELLSDTIRKTLPDQEIHLLRGTADAHGHTYGQHESYEMQIAKGWWLVGWRTGLLLMLPLVIGYRFLAAVWIFCIWLLGRATIQVASLRSRWNRYRRMHSAPGGHPTTMSQKKHLWSLHPRWLGMCAGGLRVLHWPLAYALWGLIYCFALVSHRRHLSAFFASRCIIDGAGYLDSENRYWVSVRSAMVNSVIGFGSYGKERPIFRCDSWLRGLCIGPLWSVGNYFSLFRERQRVEIAIGDSGMCEQSQYVRFGATALVLDLVEKSSPQLPRLNSVVESIGRFAKDWKLVASVRERAARGALERRWTALDIQHSYATAVRHFLQSKSNIPIEAWKILDQWQTTLNQLLPTDNESNLPKNMLGRIDWLSKLWLLHQMKTEVSWEVRKKIDLRYHEISNEGYHRRLLGMLGLPLILNANEIARAHRSPPLNSPATRRGYIIREFSQPECKLRVDWTHAEFFVEGEKRSVRF